MRRRTLQIISWLVSICMMYIFVLPTLLAADFFGLSKTIYFIALKNIAAFSASFVFANLIEKLLVKINKKILEWRKMRGNDIEEQEKFESETGFISLSINDEK